MSGVTDSSEEYSDSEYDSHSEPDDVNDEDYTCESSETESDYSESESVATEEEDEVATDDSPKSSIVRSLIVAAVLAVSVNLVWYINTTHQFSEKLYIEYLKASSNIDF